MEKSTHQKNKYHKSENINQTKLSIKSLLVCKTKTLKYAIMGDSHYTMQYAIRRVSCDSVFHVKMLAHPQIHLIEFLSSVARFRRSDRCFMECRAIRGLMRRGSHNPKFVWLRLSSIATCDWRSCDSVFDVNMVHEILLL